jgi:hypothetical protein
MKKLFKIKNSPLAKYSLSSVFRGFSNIRLFSNNYYYKNFCEKINQEANLMAEFENMLSKGEDNQDKRVKLLSLKLLGMQSSIEILNFFEEKYIKGLVSNIYGEELLLLIYFYTSRIEMESSDQRRLQILDNRFNKYIDMLKSKLDELDISNLVALCWSLSILISKFGFTIPLALRVNILEKLPNDLDIDKKGEIPTICFSLSTFFDPLSTKNEEIELQKLVQEKIIRYSELFCNIVLTI